MKIRIKILIGAICLLCDCVAVVLVTNASQLDYKPTTLYPQPISHINKVVTDTKESAAKDPLIESYILTPDDLEAEIFDDSLEYLACCVEAEAGNQSELGKRLVCDVILNRFYSGSYSNFYEVIDEEYQFAVVGNGSILEVEPTEETIRIVQEELENRTNTEVMFFRTEHYHTFGTPMFKEGDHYFSK